MSKGSACFYCKNSENPRPDEIGWMYDCKFEIDNSNMNGHIDQVVQCPKGDPRQGFQIGGFYSHMWFESECKHDIPEPDQCLRWVIMSDGDFAIQEDEDTEPIEFHICDFEQIECFVEFWRDELERKGLIRPRQKQYNRQGKYLGEG